MGNFIDAVNDAVRSAFCGIVGGTATIDGFMRDVGLPGTGAYQDRTRAIRRQVCDDPEPTVPVPGPPEYSQCYEGIDFPEGIRVNISTSGIFPTCHRKFVVNFINENQGIYNVTFTNCDGSTVTTNGGPPTVIDRGCCNGDRDPIDPCGSAPIPPYQPVTTITNITYEDNSQTTINEGIDVTIFAPIVGINGQIFAPVTISGNDFNLVGEATISPRFNLRLTPEINIGVGGGSTDDPPPEPDIPSPEPTPDERREVIVGAIVTATAVNQQRQDFLPQGLNPDIAIPNLGYLNFYISTPNATAWTADIPIKNVRSYIPCPVASGAVDVAATARNGIAISVEPVWAYPSQQL